MQIVPENGHSDGTVHSARLGFAWKATLLRARASRPLKENRSAKVLANDNHAMIRAQARPQPIGGDHPTDATAEDQDSL